MQEASREKSGKVIIKKCHLCGTFNESFEEPKRCASCKKAFLPTNYFSKIHAKNSEDYSQLFVTSDEIHDEDLIKGLTVIW